MKKTAAVVTVVLLLLAAQAAFAVDLEAGWYVKLGGVALHGIVPGEGTWTTGWNFVDGLGDHGPFRVTGFDTRVPQRMVSVPEDAFNVAPGTSVYLWGEPDSPVVWPVSEVVVYWDSYYQASKMRLELLKYTGEGEFAVLWVQDESGASLHWDNVLTQGQEIEVESVPVFRVTVVPEPASAIVLAIGSVLQARRRRNTQ